MAVTDQLFENIISKTLNPSPDDSDWHLMTLFALVLQSKSKNILELGVRYGTTTEPLLLGASYTGGRLTCVDISPTQWSCPDELKHIYNFVQSDALHFLRNSKEYYDFVYIDDWHAYEHVKAELELLEPLIDKRTIICLHDLMAFTAPDYHWPIESPVGTEWSQGGPTRAIFELDPKIWEFSTIPVNNGFTILRKIA